MKLYTKVAIMLSSIVFCAGLMLLIVAFWEGRNDVQFGLGTGWQVCSTSKWISLATGSALGGLVGIKLVK